MPLLMYDACHQASQDAASPPAARHLQVGAPKEEELHDWSHHAGVASVPDPVFAKSQLIDTRLRGGVMQAEEDGGEPLVSFVFACEIVGCAVVEGVAGLRFQSPGCNSWTYSGSCQYCLKSCGCHFAMFCV